VSASASREQMGYNYDTLKSYLPEAVELLVDCVRNPLFLDSEVEEQVRLLPIYFIMMLTCFQFCKVSYFIYYLDWTNGAADPR